jgi:UDP-N-acetylmuramyl pentapeptide phosphotransferase/UDP-N-acetylglucosamine-1-phosphate transferase
MTSSFATWRFIGGFGVLVAAALASAALIMLLRPWLQRYAMARPNARSSHTAPTPQSAGIAVIVSTLGVTVIVLLVAGAYGPPIPPPFWLVVVATGIIAIVGAVDDIRTIAISPRIFLQTITVAIVIAALPADLHLLKSLPWWIERTLLLLAGVWFVNLVNFMDGIDWMTVAEIVPVTGGLILIGVLVGAVPQPAMVVATALCGAMLGFAPFNRPIAKLFLGDVGSLPIGLLLFWLLALLANNGHVAAALILPLYYFADTALTLLRRIFHGESFWKAHRSHFYQKATERGFSVLQVIARVFAVNLVLVMLAVLTVLVPGAASAASAIACAVLLVGWLLFGLARGKR